MTDGAALLSLAGIHTISAAITSCTASISPCGAGG